MDLNVEVEETEEESEEIKQKIETLRQRENPVNILVIGPTGSGKSTLINNMMGGNVARVSHSMESGQSLAQVHEGEHKGIKIRVYDTVGFGNSESQVNSSILNAQGNFNLVLLCIDINGRANRNLRTILSDLKSNLHIELWKHLIVVLTHTNLYIDQQNKSVAEKKAAVEKRITEFKRRMYSLISSHVNRDTFDKIIFCTVGTRRDREIKPLLEENWLHSLWASCID
ncbi:PREDICTED: uncharacterized protein LOC109590751 [Amphimedon queenslandica]|uniref:AIG1-type G domain-containing protein n=1 Tax=Amphimedon queenslandica TaxID=400682 RepID=A0A1X7SYN2_AMPQE|nr:PREDICTED: uncharacterized protein LOC109590751 [Amphimedon queenslandica]|eukprot:XP_019862188.1 PREDICTED: uncharacterized protein LOC109590751 [Amphimedon queenslandica]